MIKFGKKDKLVPRYIEPFELLERIGEKVYRLALPPQLSRIHDVFHVSMLMKYVPSSDHILERNPLDLQPNLTYEEQPLKILDQNEKKLRNRTLKFVKVQWKNHTAEEATWEREEDLKQSYPHLFNVS